MLVELLKCIHVILAMSLMGLVLYSFLSASLKKTGSSAAVRKRLIRTNKLMLGVALLALLSGSALVIPRHYTFHTPWIRAAYILLPSFILLLIAMTLYKIRMQSGKVTYRKLWSLRFAYMFLLVLLLFLVRDAVTKSTFLHFIV